MKNQLLSFKFLVIPIFLIYSSVLYPIRSKEAQEIGKKIWANECSGSVNGLTTWRVGEDFASLGIGHSIWHPPKKQQLFKETFPDLIQFMKKHKVSIPKNILLMSNKGCPWHNRKDFYQKFYSKDMLQLRHFLHSTIDTQTMFMIKRLEDALPKIIRSTNNRKQALHIKQQYARLANSSHGWYPLIDYLNFKGEGLEDHKHYNNINWGLKQVLLEMKGKKRGAQALKDFAQAAKLVLQKRVKNAPKKQKALEQQWLKGWFNRIDTYVTA